MPIELYIILALVIIVSSIWVFWDTFYIGVKKKQIEGFGKMGNIEWFVACLTLWILAFPLYLIKRREYKKVNERENCDQMNVLQRISKHSNSGENGFGRL